MPRQTYAYRWRGCGLGDELEKINNIKNGKTEKGNNSSMGECMHKP